MLKTSGYVISSLSVLLLGIASYDGVKDKPLLLACLVLGMASSIGGMALRWASFLKEEKPPRSSSRRLSDERLGETSSRLGLGAAVGERHGHGRT